MVTALFQHIDNSRYAIYNKCYTASFNNLVIGDKLREWKYDFGNGTTETGYTQVSYDDLYNGTDGYGWDASACADFNTGGGAGVLLADGINCSATKIFTQKIRKMF